jgi:GGDEF domain-containing protein
VISILNPREIFKSARIAFLMILAATIATIILIMYAKIYPEQNKEVPQQKNEPELDVQLLESAPPDARTLQDLPLEIPEELPDFEISPRETGGLFYSLETGFMKETFINQVLDPILISADSYNEDIALLIVSVPGLDRISSEGEDLSRCFLDQFQSKECIFEYQNDGFAVIMRNTDIEKAVQEAEALYITLNEILNPEGTNGQREPVEIGMGISTKTFRTALGASHLFSEARQAVARALENDETPIVALKINPEKYQEFLKKNYSQDEVPVS